MNTDSIDAFRNVAVVIPCFNEAPTIGKVVHDFRCVLPNAIVYVFDNNSTDETAARALAAGACLRHEKRQGKGFVIANMLATIDADYYVMVDGDDTYPAEKAHDLLLPLFADTADMVVGQRLSEHSTASFPPLHVFGNKLIRNVINLIFGSALVDVMSGYRAFTRTVADHLPVVASGFDVETEMTLQLLYRGFIVKEVPVAYRERPLGSSSKLRTFHDGILVLLKILGIFKAYKPLTFFGGMGLLAFLTAAVPGTSAIGEYLRDGRLTSFVGALMTVGLLLAGFMLATIGVTLHTVNFRIFEMTNVLSKQILRAARQSERVTVETGKPAPS